MTAESGRSQRHRQPPWIYVLAIASVLPVLAVLLFPWGASAYHVERAGRVLQVDDPSGALYRTAEQELWQALERDPSNEQAYRQLALLYTRQGERRAAVEALNQFVALKPENPLGYWELAQACEQLELSELALVIGQPCGTDEVSRQAALVRLWQGAGQSAADFVRAGDRLRLSEDWEQALAFYGRALLLESKTASAWDGLASVHLARGELDAALETYARMAAITSDANLIASAHNQRGEILADNGRWAEASAELAQAVALMPDEGAYYHLYGWYLYKAGGHVDEARAALINAAALMPTNPWPHLHLADLYFAQEDYAEMLVHAQQATELRPALVWGWVAKGRALRYLDRLAEAEQALRHAAAIAPHEAAARAELGHVLRQLTRLDEAAEEYQSAISLAPSNVWHHLSLASTYRIQGKKVEAVDTYQRVLELDPDNTVARQALSELEP